MYAVMWKGKRALSRSVRIGPEFLLRFVFCYCYVRLTNSYRMHLLLVIAAKLWGSASY
uniref:Uncharacterized protein n=1 Tax=Anguilla anguilla TaxID=7936 RepID=A0A0E9XQB9_ANGAN